MGDDNLSVETINRYDEKTFHRIYSLYFRALVAFAMQLTGDEEVSRDIVQDMFSALWEKKTAFLSYLSFKAYLFNSVRNASLDYLRHQRVESNYMEKLIADNPEYNMDDTDPGEQFYEEEVYRQLFLAIDELPARCREVFLHYMKGKKNEEIAEALHISVETVKTQKKRGLSVLRKKLADADYLLLLFILS